MNMTSLHAHRLLQYKRQKPPATFFFDQAVFVTSYFSSNFAPDQTVLLLGRTSHRPRPCYGPDDQTHGSPTTVGALSIPTFWPKVRLAGSPANAPSLHPSQKPFLRSSSFWNVAELSTFRDKISVPSSRVQQSLCSRGYLKRCDTTRM